MWKPINFSQDLKPGCVVRKHNRLFVLLTIIEAVEPEYTDRFAYVLTINNENKITEIRIFEDKDLALIKE